MKEKDKTGHEREADSRPARECAGSVEGAAAESEDAAKRLHALRMCLEKLGTDPGENIKRLIVCSVDVTRAICAFYCDIKSGDPQFSAFLKSPDACELPEDIQLELGHYIASMHTSDVTVIRNLREILTLSPYPWLRDVFFQTCAACPVISDGKTVGFLCILFEADMELGGLDKAMIELIASFVAVAGKSAGRGGDKQQVRDSSGKPAADPASADKELIRLRRSFHDGPGIMVLYSNEEGWPVEMVSKNISRLGYSPRDFKSGRLKYSNLIHPEDRERVKQEMQAPALWRDDQLVQEYRIITSSGNVRSVEARTSMSRDRQSGRCRYVGIILDVTERRTGEEDGGEERLELARRLEEQKAELHESNKLLRQEIANRKRAERSLQEIDKRYGELVETANDLIYRTDIRGRFTLVNQAALRVTGYSEDEMLGKHYLDLVHPDYRAEVERFYGLQPVKEASNRYFEFPMVTRQGETIWVGQNVRRLLEDDKIIGFEAICRDITGRIRAEQQLEKARDRLELTVRERTSELRKAYDEMKRFTYIVSHDLRVPLTNIRAFSRQLRSSLNIIESAMLPLVEHMDKSLIERVTVAVEQDIPEALGYIDSSTKRMETFINAVMKLSRLGNRELRLERLDLNDVVKATLRSLAHPIRERNTRITVGQLPCIVADRLSLEQILGNLLDNAVKYLDPQRPGEIEITSEQGAGRYVFRVRDNGRGIRAEEMHKVFECFRRAGKQDVPGEGMGLAYVKTLVRRHGGTISCESEPGVGTTFEFTIPDNPTETLL